MDLSFANQSLASEYLVENARKLEKKVYDVPEEIDRYIATLKLSSMGIGIDRLTDEQVRYLNTWCEGT
jgi:adenosylhomocysteinase